MKRLALLAASIAALVLFTACPNPHMDDEAEDGSYDETIELILHLSTGQDTSYFFYQQCEKDGNTIMYDPCLEFNRKNGWIRFSEYCKADKIIKLNIQNDTIFYNVKYWDKVFDSYKRPYVRVNFGRDFFSFSYAVDQASKCTHTFHRTLLSN